MGDLVSVFDVAKYILVQTGEITAMKLQKLAYYSEAWSLVWTEESLFNEDIQAWANGAVVPDLYNAHRGLFKINESQLGGKDNLNKSQKANIRKVIDFYGKYTAQQLSDINHQEEPWITARGGISPLARCTNEITRSSIFEYYHGIIFNDSEETF